MSSTYESKSSRKGEKRDEEEKEDARNAMKKTKLEAGEEDLNHQELKAMQKGSFQRYLVTVEYIGTGFVGWQKQNQSHCRTVQGVLEDAFQKFVGTYVESAGSSRTDTGVHALANVCHVDVQRTSKRRPGEILPPHEPAVVKRAVNHFLLRDAGDISIINVRCIPPDFHSRFKAKERTYYYRILASCETISIFEKDRAWHVREDLDIVSMQQACQVLIGHHDFSSFRAAGCQANSPFRTLDELHVCKVPGWPCFPLETERNISNQADLNPLRDLEMPSCTPSVELQSNKDHKDESRENAPHDLSNSERFSYPKKPCCIVVTARARSFLYHQVRLMVGVLKAVGSGALKINDVYHILEARSITATPPMAPACGLYLANVKYDFD